MSSDSDRPHQDIEPGRRGVTEEGDPPTGEHVAPEVVNDHDLPPEERLDQIVSAVMESSSGPYPPPTFLERYEAVVPGMAEKVMQSGLDRVAASIQIDILEAETKSIIDKRGQWIAGAIVIAFLVTATIWVAMGYSTAGGVLATTTLVALVVAFIGSSKIEQIAPFLRGGERVQEQQDSNPNEQ